MQIFLKDTQARHERHNKVVVTPEDEDEKSKLSLAYALSWGWLWQLTVSVPDLLKKDPDQERVMSIRRLGKVSSELTDLNTRYIPEHADHGIVCARMASDITEFLRDLTEEELEELAINPSDELVET